MKKSVENNIREIVTFKEKVCMEEMIANDAPEIHLGNSTGINELEGIDLVCLCSEKYNSILWRANWSSVSVGQDFWNMIAMFMCFLVFMRAG